MIARPMSNAQSLDYLSNVPATLKAIPSWVVWSPRAKHDGGTTKVPVDDTGLDTGAHQMLRTFDAAVIAARRLGSGVGMATGHGVCILDLDKFIGVPHLEAQVRWILAQAPTWCDRSPGMCGAHAYYLDPHRLMAAHGVKQPFLKVMGRAPLSSEYWAQIFGSTGYCTVTGVPLEIEGVTADARELDERTAAWLCGLIGEVDAAIGDVPVPGSQIVDVHVAFEPGDDRSQRVFAVACSLAASGYAPEVILDSLCAHPAIWQVALEHREHHLERARAYLWTGHVAPALQRAGAAAPATIAAPPGVWTPVRASTLRGEPAPRTWAWEDWLPDGVATGLVGPPGIAKSTLALQLCVHTVLGTPFLGGAIPRRPAVFISVEDDIDELHRRTAAIARALGVTLADLTDLHLLAAHEIDTRIVIFDRSGNELLGPAVEPLRTMLADIRPGMLVFDLLTDAASLNPNDDWQTKRYVRGYITPLAAWIQGATLGVMHPTVASMRDGRAVGGAVGWEGSFRSVLTLRRHPDVENVQILARAKANYARLTEITVQWRDGYIYEHEIRAEEQHTLALAAVRRHAGQNGAPPLWAWPRAVKNECGQRKIDEAERAGVVVRAQIRDEITRTNRVAYAVTDDLDEPKNEEIDPLS